MDTIKERPQEDKVEDVVLYHSVISTMGDSGMDRSVEGTNGYQERNKG
jgi:hypothetical protein